MSLTNVWLRTVGDGLVRADQVAGVHTHRTPGVVGKTSHWLVDVVLPTPVGSGQSDSWTAGPLHRTLVQTSAEPTDACDQLVRLLAQLDTTSASGIITAIQNEAGPRPPAAATASTAVDGATTGVRFRFTPFRATEPGRHYDPEYL